MVLELSDVLLEVPLNPVLTKLSAVLPEMTFIVLWKARLPVRVPSAPDKLVIDAPIGR